ncbi:unnamed protein product [Rotaria magnacalcarata]|uniref:MORN repeat-containing protein n=1 Tax=Rotaria magnacalcarata TaxID=392030 RepID=A0A816P5P7_9BILA|nr:unnamed protein product [Rotaria magnacalcarata]
MPSPTLAANWVTNTASCKAEWMQPLSSQLTMDWDGACVNGYIEGRGRLVWIDLVDHFQIEVEGIFIQGKLNGPSNVFDSRDNCLYQQIMVDGIANGEGSINCYLTGFSRVGQFVEGKLVRGIEQTDGNQYTGEFENDAPSGQGELKYKNGSIYIGRFKNGQPNGHGKRINTISGIVSEGEFKNGELSGKGIRTSPEGRREEGHFEHFMMHTAYHVEIHLNQTGKQYGFQSLELWKQQWSE